MKCFTDMTPQQSVHFDIQQPHAIRQPNYWLIAAVIAFPALLRWLGQPWNLTPVGGIALFAGAYLGRSRWAIAIPIAAMMLSDLTWGLMRGDVMTYTFHSVIPFVYGSYVLFVLLGRRVRTNWDRADSQTSEVSPQPVWKRAVGHGFPLCLATLGGSLLFYLITNFGMWMMYTTYPHTLGGLIQCYIAGLPFLRPTIVGDAFYTTVFFGAFAVVQVALTQPTANILSKEN